MKLKLAKSDLLDSKCDTIEVKKIEEEVEKKGFKILYFDKENSHKDLLDLQDHFENNGKSFYMREVKYGLNENEYIYEVHIL